MHGFWEKIDREDSDYKIQSVIIYLFCSRNGKRSNEVEVNEKSKEESEFWKTLCSQIMLRLIDHLEDLTF